MIISDDTICAISTPAGVGGIAIVRISGTQAIEIANKVWKGKSLLNQPSHTATFGRIVDEGTTLDEGVATVFRAPHSFTGENVVELSVHGSVWVQKELINLLIRKGCRMAHAGEFTRRAFAAGKMDLAEAEAVADVIASTSRASHRVAIAQMRGTFSARLSELREKLLELASLLELELDFSEEDVEFADRQRLMSLSEETLSEVNRLASSFATGDAIRRGVPVAIIGEPNVGKSSILNRLIGDERAIVSDIPGTTRDTVEDSIDINGITFRFIDTAGLRDTSDSIEALGIERAWNKIASARIVLWVVTPASNLGKTLEFAKELSERRAADAKTILVLNKTDLIDNSNPGHTPHNANNTHNCIADIAETGKCNATIELSATQGTGIDSLRTTLAQLATESIPGGIDAPDTVIVINARHYEALTNASQSLQRAIDGLATTLPADLIAQDIRETLHHLASITGAITTPDILATIFSRFCIGK